MLKPKLKVIFEFKPSLPNPALPLYFTKPSRPMFGVMK
jgi:hypothetical protein